MLMLAVVLGLGICITSCNDDEGAQSEQRNEDADPLDTDEAQVAWRWLCALTDAESLTKDWAKKTYQPTVGVASEDNQTTRIMVVADLDEAKANFADLADVVTSRLNEEYTVSQIGVGRMTWTPSKQGAQNLAEVAVDTKLIPQLQKLVYCTKDQVGVNGIFGSNVTGTAYYRFGDVISRKNDVDNSTEYWICVRPSFEQNDKGDSHWIRIFNKKVNNDLPQKNIYSSYNQVQKYNYNTIKLPTSLKYKREHLNNFTNFVLALLDPEDYANRVDVNGTKNGLGGFDYNYHGVGFLKRVAQFWDDTEIDGQTLWQVLFNRTHEQMQNEMKNMILLYKGYRWRIGTTGYVWEFKASREAGFQKSAPGSESDDMVLYDFGNEGYDITRYISADGINQNTGGPVQFGVNGDYRWVVTYATGDELMQTGKYLPYAEMNGYQDVYRYNEKTGQQTQSKLETDSDMRKEDFYYSIGDVVRYKDRLYLCTNEHKLFEQARFVTLNDQEDHETDTFIWTGVGRDTVFTDDMASDKTLYYWVSNFLYNTQRYTSLRTALQKKDIPLDQWNQVIPQTDHMRHYMMSNMTDTYHMIVDCSADAKGHAMVVSGIHRATMFTSHIYHDSEGNELDPNFDPDDEKNKFVYGCSPAGILLANKMRYSQHITGRWDQWVPYIFVIRDKDGDFARFKTELDAIPCMSTLSPSHFKWADLGTFYVAEKMVQPEDPQSHREDIGTGTYHVVLLAVYWQHVEVLFNRSYYRLLMNFPFDWTNSDKEWAKDPDRLWDRHCITSREYVISDNGVKDPMLEDFIVSKAK